MGPKGIAAFVCDQGSPDWRSSRWTIWWHNAASSFDHQSWGIDSMALSPTYCPLSSASLLWAACCLLHWEPRDHEDPRQPFSMQASWSLHFDWKTKKPNQSSKRSWKLWLCSRLTSIGSLYLLDGRSGGYRCSKSFWWDLLPSEQAWKRLLLYHPAAVRPPFFRMSTAVTHSRTCAAC